jgi:DNA polymerase-3 subunit beta
MELQVLQENFAKAVSLATRFTSARAQLPVLANILLSVEKNKLVLSATNLEISISMPIGAKIKSTGKITVPARILTEIVSNLRPGPLNLKSEKELLELTQANFKSTITGMNASDFPSLPQEPKENAFTLIPKEDFFEAISKVLYSVSQDETRPTLTGVLFAQKRDKTVVVSTDGFRLSKKEVDWESKSYFGSLIVPKSVLNEIMRFSIESNDMGFLYDKKEKQIVYKIDEALVSSRLIEGDYPDFEKIIPKNHITSVNVDKADFVKSIKLGSVFARDSANVVTLEAKKGSLSILSESQYSGVQKNSLEAKVEGEDLTIAFNYRFLEEFANSIPGESVAMEFKDSQSAGVFKDPSDGKYLHLIMPVKI